MEQRDELETEILLMNLIDDITKGDMYIELNTIYDVFELICTIKELIFYPTRSKMDKVIFILVVHDILEFNDISLDDFIDLSLDMVYTLCKR